MTEATIKIKHFTRQELTLMERSACFWQRSLMAKLLPHVLSGLKNANAKRRVFERKGPERKPWPRGKPLERKK